MLIGENIRLAFSALMASKMRSLLTMLGIIIGITSVIAIITISESLTAEFTSQLNSLGANTLTIQVQEKDRTEDNENIRAFQTDDDRLTEDRIERFKEAFSEQILHFGLSQNLMGASSAQANDTTVEISATGVNNDFLQTENLTMLTGRMLNDLDSDERKQVTLVSDTLCETLFGNADPIGQTIEIEVGGVIYPFYIVGVYENAEEESIFGMSSAESIYIPLSFATLLAGTNDVFSSMTIGLNPDYDADVLQADIDAYFVNDYRNNEFYYAQTFSMQAMVDSISATFDIVSYVLSAIAAISLVVGGIGVMNIMLVAITERTREIGIRKALGATNASIRFQFITESVIICLVGGVIGILLGTASAALIAVLADVEAQASLFGISLAFGFSTFIGVFFGYYPANKAAKLNLIEALKYE